MIKKLSLALILASAPFVSASAQPAASESPAAEQSAQPAAAAAEEQRAEAPAERRICRRVEATGQRTGGQRLCLTAQQWRRSAD